MPFYILFIIIIIIIRRAVLNFIQKYFLSQLRYLGTNSLFKTDNANENDQIQTMIIL